jgi:hypothetical protein
MRRLVLCVLLQTLPLAAWSSGRAADSDSDLEPLPYNNAGLVVDLGVGLWAWPLPMDYDGDGDLDLVVSCPDKPSNGTYFFENPGGNMKMPVFKPGRRIGAGHNNIRVSWIDGKPRVLTPDREFENFTTSQFSEGKKLGAPTQMLTHNRKLRANQWHIVDYDGNGVNDLVIGIGDWKEYGWDDAWNAQGKWMNGPLHGLVFVYPNRGTNDSPKYSGSFPVEAAGQPVDVFGWPSPNFADFDGDGDLDLLCGEFIDRFTYFQNVGTRTAPEYAAGQFLKDGDKLLTMELQMIVPSAIDWDGDGDVDLICGDEDGRVAFIEHTGEVKNGVPVFARPMYFQQEAEHLKCGALATPYCADWDGDGDEDILSGNTAGYVEFFENLGTPAGLETPRWARPVRLSAGGEVIRIQAGPNGSIQGPCEAKWGYTTFVVADWDHDGQLDIVLNSIWGKVLWYRNEGTKTAPKLAAAQNVEVDWPGATPVPKWTWWQPEGRQLATQWRTTPVVADFTGDGLNDLVMLDQEGYLALFERSAGKRASGSESPLTLKSPRRAFIDVRGQAIRLNGRDAGGSGRRKLHAIDWDGDGDLDLLMNGVNADLLENAGTEDGETLMMDRGPLGIRRLAGHTSSPATAAFRGTGRRELLVGAEDGVLYLQRRAEE